MERAGIKSQNGSTRSRLWFGVRYGWAMIIKQCCYIMFQYSLFTEFSWETSEACRSDSFEYRNRTIWFENINSRYCQLGGEISWVKMGWHWWFWCWYWPEEGCHQFGKSTAWLFSKTQAINSVHSTSCRTRSHNGKQTSYGVDFKEDYPKRVGHGQQLAQINRILCVQHNFLSIIIRIIIRMREGEMYWLFLILFIKNIFALQFLQYILWCDRHTEIIMNLINTKLTITTKNAWNDIITGCRQLFFILFVSNGSAVGIFLFLLLGTNGMLKWVRHVAL